MGDRVDIPLSEVHIDDSVRRAISEVLESGWFILGEKVAEFVSVLNPINNFIFGFIWLNNLM